MKKLWLDCSKMKKLQKSLRSLLPIIIVALLVACNGKKENNDSDVTEVSADSLSNSQVNDRLLIVGGNRIGNIGLEGKADELNAILGKPDLSDSAMGKAWLTWFSKVSDSITGHELNVYTEYKDNSMMEKVVRQIRITSDEFETAEGIKTGMVLDEIVRLTRGKLTLVGKYDTTTPTPISVFDNIGQGIAFEIEDNVCVGIIVHSKEEPVSEEYISFHPDMKPL